MTMNHENNQNDATNQASMNGQELDALLRRWHEVNRDRAAAGREAILSAIRHGAAGSGAMRINRPERKRVQPLTMIRQAVLSRYSRLAAALIVLVGVAALLLPMGQRESVAGVVMLPDGGRLEARDEHGQVLGPCPLQHTDVDVQVSGFFSRVTLKQRYVNPYPEKVEAVYVFPMSHRAAVDRMTMTVGDRVVVGEVKEREEARQIYEAARDAGHVASLLEQERPNIFTQSVANIEPDAEIVVEISYVETLPSRDGVYEFAFPMVVGPRYIPGTPVASQFALAEGLTVRRGIILQGPGTFERVMTKAAVDEAKERGEPIKLAFDRIPVGPAAWLSGVLDRAIAIEQPSPAWRDREEIQQLLRAKPPILFLATYANGAVEAGELAGDGLGHVAGRWFYVEPGAISKAEGGGFGVDTNQVPDASRITPMPVRPPTRAGHDISVTVTIDTGGPGLRDVKCNFDVKQTAEAKRDDGLPRRLKLEMSNAKEIPNQDYVLSWRQTADSVQEAAFAYSGRDIDGNGGFFTLMLQPPARVEDAATPARELIFVLDTSGSMNGFPMEKSKEVVSKAIASMRAADTFNVITFAGETRILWQQPKPATAENREAALRFVSTLQGGGGTEMMKAINAALVQTVDGGKQLTTAAELVNQPADGRAFELRVPYASIEMGDAGEQPYQLAVRDGLRVAMRFTQGDPPTVLQPEGVEVRLSGSWRTEDGERILVVERAEMYQTGENGAAWTQRAMRIVMFLTDGYVGNDEAIVQAVRDNARTTRVFSFGIGNSVNRFLLDAMAQAGRGEVEYVMLADQGDAAVERFTKRIASPVLADVQILFDGIEVAGVMPSPEMPGGMPDLFDVKPLIVQGRYTKPGRGTVTVKGWTGAGPWERTLAVELPELGEGKDHDVIATLWARERVSMAMNRDLNAVQSGNPPPALRQEVVDLGVKFGIMTRYTSFVAVEKSRVTIGGKPMLVNVPIELPAGTDWRGFFGGDVFGRQPRNEQDDALELRLGLDVRRAEGGHLRIVDSGQQLIRPHQEQLRLRPSSPAGGLGGGMGGGRGGGGGNMPAAPAPAATPPPPPRAPSEPADTAAGRTAQQHLQRARQLQMEGNNDQAMQEAQRVLVDDPHNDAALLMRDVLSAVKSYQAHGRDERQRDPNYPSSLMQYPEGWPMSRSSETSSFYYQHPDSTREGYKPIGMVQNSMGEPLLGQLAEFDLSSFAGNSTLPSSAPVQPGQGTGGGAGGGGNIFGAPGGQPSAPFSDEEFVENVVRIIMETIQPDGWTMFGGDRTSIEHKDGVLRFTVGNDSDEAIAMIEQARAFVVYLSAHVPDVQRLVKLDQQPTRPFMLHDRVLIYDVRDLTNLANGNENAPGTQTMMLDEATFNIANMVMDFSAEIKWWADGMSLGDIAPISSGFLIIVQTPENHAAITRLLDQIRHAAGLPTSQPVATTGSDVIRVYDVRDLVKPILAKTDRWTHGVLGALFHSRVLEGITASEATSRIGGFVMDAVDDGLWKDHGTGSGTLHAIPNLLIVGHTAEVHAQIAIVLDELRQAAALPAQKFENATGRTRGYDIGDLVEACRDSRRTVLFPILNAFSEEVFCEHAPAGGIGSYVRAVTSNDRSAWRGGKFGLLYAGQDFLLVRQTEEMHTAVARTLDWLRLIAGIDPKGDVSTEDRAQAEQVLRAMRLSNVLHEKLWPAAQSGGSGESIEDANATASDLRIVILVTELDAAIRSRLEHAGLRIEATAKGKQPLVVGHVQPGRLADVAMVNGVRRIEEANLRE